VIPGSAAATHVLEIVEGLRRRGYPVVLKAEHGEKRGGVREQAKRYVRLSLEGLAALRSADLVYVRSHFAAAPVAFAARFLGRPVIQEINGIYDEAFVTHPRFGRLKRALTVVQRQQYRWASAIVAVTPDLAAWGSREAGHGRAYHLGNGANTTLFRPDGPRAQRERPYVFFFGGLTRWHGVEVMLQAARSRAWPAGVELLVAGPVVDPSLQPLLDDPPGNVSWLGPVPQPELPPLIRGALAALVPSLDPKGIAAHGLTPLKLFEMLACGTPVVASDFPGMADIVRAGPCGHVIPPGDPEALARAVADLAGNPEAARAMGAAGARLIAAEHSWDARAAETARAIDEVLARPR
jgi:glycosyltransferase involved in cell wall biosynthesis